MLSRIETCLGFSTLKIFTEVSTLAAYGGFFLYIGPACCTHQNICMTFQNILSFLLIFCYEEKVVEERNHKVIFFFIFW